MFQSEAIELSDVPSSISCFSRYVA